MATPRPFNAPTEFKPNISPLGEVTRQVERMKALGETAPKPAPKPGFNPMDWLTKYTQGSKPKTGPTPAKPMPPKSGPIKSNIPGSRVAGGLVRAGGLATAISPDKSIGLEDRALGATMAINPLLGTAVAAGAGIGKWMQENVAVNTAGSGRGAGRSAFNPAATAQPPQSSGKSVTRIGGKTYDLSDPVQKAAYDKVIAADRATRPGQKFADLRGGDGISSRDAEPPTKNPNNIDQKGTIMGRSSLSMEDAQTYVGKDVQIKNPFLSNALPGTNDDGFAGGDSPVIESIDGKVIKGGPISINEYNTRYSNDNKPVEIQKTEGSANLVQSGGVKVNDIEDSSTWTEDYARRRAFLDADDSMSGLKAVQASKGIVYAGGQHNLVNPNAGQKGENDFIKIDRPDAQAYMRGAQGAEDLKAKYIDKIKASKPAPFENVGDTPIASSPVESPINMNDSPADFVAPLTDMPAYTDKDHTGRFNIFRRS